MQSCQREPPRRSGQRSETARQRREKILRKNKNSDARHSRQEEREERRLVELPGHARETANALVGKLAERGGREVEREHVAGFAAVGEHDCDGLASPFGWHWPVSKGFVRNSRIYVQVAVAVLPQMGLLLGFAPV